jgi:hypothetical protein
MKKFFLTAIFVLGCMGQMVASERNITGCEPGKLSVLLNSTDAKTTTTLILSGEIDARDFRYLQDSFPVLNVLDIENVKIKSYDGRGGTI